MNRKWFRNIVIVISLAAFILHAKSHILHEVSHSQHGYECLCEQEKSCHSCPDENLVIDKQTFDLYTISFSLKTLSTFELQEEIAEFRKSSEKKSVLLFLFNRSFLI